MCSLAAAPSPPSPLPASINARTHPQGFLSLAPKSAVQRLKGGGGAALGAAEYSSPRPEPKGASKGAKGGIKAGEGGKAGGIKAGAASITVDCSGGTFRLRPSQ